MRQKHKNLIGTSLLVLIFGIGCPVLAQGKQALVLMRTGSVTPAACDGTAEINFQSVYDLRLYNKDEIRLFDNAAVGGRSPDTINVSRKGYEDAPKNKLVNMHQIKWRDGFLYVLSSPGRTPLLVLPDDMKPQKNSEMPVSSFYSVMLSGEAREGKQKRKINVPLRDFWKIYFIPDGGNVNDVLFSHAQEERSVAVWDAFLKKTNNYRAEEANNNMRDALIACVRSSLNQFLNGNYSALEVARERTERAQSVKADEATNKLSLEIGQHKKRVSDAREQLVQLVSASRWDDAITSAEPVKIYLSTWEDLNPLYTKALEESHKLHLSKGRQALEGNQLDAAKSECTIAWERLPDSSEARGCVCMSRNRIALRDSVSFRQRKQPRQAKELLEKQLADSDCTRDEAVAKELGVSKCEYSQQLFDEAQKLTSGGGAVVTRPPKGKKPTTPISGGLKTITAQNKKDFRDAREKLILAGEMCSRENAKEVLDKVNRSLSSYSVAEAKKASQRADFGTAYVYLMSAQNYTPESENVTMLLNQARTQFEEKTQVNIGVVFSDKTGDRNAESVLNAVSSEIELNVTRVGLARPVILERNQTANALRAIQNGTNLLSPTAIFSGDLLEANVSVNTNDRTIRSYYSEENPVWKARDRAHDDANEVYKNCKKQLGEVGCSSQANTVRNLRVYRDSVEHYPKYYYDYHERYYKITGSARLTFRYMDSISRSARAADTLTAAVADQCIARTGVDSRDGSARNAECNQIRDTNYLDQMVGRLQSEASSRAYSLLRDLPASFYKRAKSSANRQQGVEDLLRFLFLTSEKSGADAEDAKRILLDFDTELKTDGVLR